MAIGKKRCVVGIFSRDAEDNYVWLINMLQSNYFQKVVQDVRSVYISNNHNGFRKDLQNCTFAILYHTQNRGRLNVTNVTDSLYDVELDKMNYEYGKENIIVLMDDLEDSSQQTKFQILNEQYDIEKKVSELFLISEMEKESCNLKSNYPIWSEEPTSLHLQEQHKSMKKKRKQIRDIIAKSSKVDTGRDSPDTSSQSSSESPNNQKIAKRDFTDNNSQATSSNAGTNPVSYGGDLAPLISVLSGPSPPGNREHAVQVETSPVPEESKSPARKLLFGKLSNKTVFIILGVVGGILLIVLIIILATM